MRPPTRPWSGSGPPAPDINRHAHGGPAGQWEGRPAHAEGRGQALQASQARQHHPTQHRRPNLGRVKRSVSGE